MRRQTRKLLLNLATGLAVATTAIVVFLPAAQAAPGVATANVNVRSGPGTGYGVVDVLQRGQSVDVQRCQGSWCYVVKSGPDGWVSSSYLSGGSGNSDDPNINFGFSVGPNGPSFSIGVGEQPRPPIVVDPPRPPRVGEVCFFEGTRFRGDSFCLEPGERARLPRYADGIGSIDNPDRYRVDVCTRDSYRDCRTYTTSASSLGEFGDYVEAVRVR
jgi:uncharacterized protein YraI